MACTCHSASCAEVDLLLISDLKYARCECCRAIWAQAPAGSRCAFFECAMASRLRQGRAKRSVSLYQWEFRSTKVLHTGMNIILQQYSSKYRDAADRNFQSGRVGEEPAHHKTLLL